MNKVNFLQTLNKTLKAQWLCTNALIFWFYNLVKGGSNGLSLLLHLKAHQLLLEKKAISRRGSGVKGYPAEMLAPSFSFVVIESVKEEH